MKMVPASATKEGFESPSRVFNMKEKLGKQLHFFSVDRNNRWPVQGWSSGSDEAHHELDEKFVAQESAKEFTLDKETRWPLQGWCKAHKPYNTSAAGSSKPAAVPSRWPQGW